MKGKLRILSAVENLRINLGMGLSMLGCVVFPKQALWSLQWRYADQSLIMIPNSHGLSVIAL